jgi:hypothetical protein
VRNGSDSPGWQNPAGKVPELHSLENGGEGVLAAVYAANNRRPKKPVVIPLDRKRAEFVSCRFRVYSGPAFLYMPTQPLSLGRGITSHP